MKIIGFLTITFLCNCVFLKGGEQPPATNPPAILKKANNIAYSAAKEEAYKVIPEMQGVINSWVKGSKINGLACALAFDRTTFNSGAPFCSVNVINTTSNTIAGFLRLPLEAVSHVELFDPLGSRVPPTLSGQRFSYWSTERINEQLKKIDPTTMRRKGYFGIRGLLYVQLGSDFSITQAFQVKEPGEYTFHMSVRLVRSEQDQYGQFLTTQLPEVVAKVQIQPQDIPSEIPPTQNQTNSPAK